MDGAHDGAAGVHDVAHCTHDDGSCPSIQPGGGLVHENDGGVGNQLYSDGQPLPLFHTQTTDARQSHLQPILTASYTGAHHLASCTATICLRGWLQHSTSEVPPNNRSLLGRGYEWLSSEIIRLAAGKLPFLDGKG